MKKTLNKILENHTQYTEYYFICILPCSLCPYAYIFYEDMIILYIYFFRFF